MARRALLCLTMFSINFWAVQGIPLPLEIQTGLKNPGKSFPAVFIKREGSAINENVRSHHVPTTGYKMNNATSYVLWERSADEMASPTTPLAEPRETNLLGSFGRNKLKLIDKNSERIVDAKVRSDFESEIDHSNNLEEPQRDFTKGSPRVNKPNTFENNDDDGETWRNTQEDIESTESPDTNSSDEVQGLTVTRETEEGGAPCPTVPATWTPYITDRELQCVVNPHWLEFDPPSHLSHLVLGAIYIIILIVGCFGNGLVIYLFASSRSLRTPSNLFILNLALSDFCMVGILVVYVHNAFHDGPAAGKFGCDLYGFVSGLAGTTSIMTMSAISLDRYLVISFPLDPFKRFSHRQVLVIIIATWLYSSIFSSIPLLGIVGINYTPEGYLTSCSFDYLSHATRTRVYIFSFFIAAWLLPLNIIFFSYVSIVVTVSKQERQSYTCQGNVGSSSFKNFKHQSVKRKKSVELKLAKVASGIIALWVLAWTPYAVVALLGIFNQRRLITPFGSMVPAMICKAAACIDPYVYALSHPRFKNELNKRLLRRQPDFFGVTRNGITVGLTGSTFSEIKEEREMPDPQMWDLTDQSYSSSMGPLIHRQTSFSSHPAVQSTDASLSLHSTLSPGSNSLAGETYPKRSFSSNSFRKMPRSFNLSHDPELGASRSTGNCDRRRLQTTVLVEFPDRKLPFDTSHFIESAMKDKMSLTKHPRKPPNGFRFSPSEVDCNTGKEQRIGLIMSPSTKGYSKTKSLRHKKKRHEAAKPLMKCVSNVSLPSSALDQGHRVSLTQPRELHPSKTFPNIFLPSEELEGFLPLSTSLSVTVESAKDSDLSSLLILNRRLSCVTKEGLTRSVVSSVDLSLPCARYVKECRLRSKSLPNITDEAKEEDSSEENQYERLSFFLISKLENLSW
ncbi:uncharacterized protein LOC125036587 isoform X2 [Penaeus chinensis]|uniref:uncharacterized protein LOC125036587 isoform X2 n=1 Tax=Penaeus chinensis TaxID=139456 RepID=UPI001FB71ED3|nr:uncharacterized protein LOC125036587 isoform X2 [Penaeus chinensis]